jgi:hypothetical protein
VGRNAVWRSRVIWACLGRALGDWTGVLRRSEGYTTRDPVNQQIEAGEPVVSENDSARTIQRGDQESHQGNDTGRETDGKIDGLCDCVISGAIEQMERQRSDRVGLQKVFIHKLCVYESIQRTGIY